LTRATEISSAEAPRFEIGQRVLVDQGLRGRIIATARGTVPGIPGQRPLKTWVYVVETEDGGEQQPDIPEYNLMAWDG
jgi:hypothetical protein